MDFISFCNTNKFLLMVFPLHLTHSLQPLDVVLFAPLSSAYSADLLRYLHRSQELLSVKKGDFFMLFWGAWKTSFKEKTVLQNFKATGIFPMNAQVILEQFNKTQSNSPNTPISQHKGNDTSWNKLQFLYNNAVKDTSSASAKELSGALHSLQVNHELYIYKIQGLRQSLTTKRKHNKKGKLLDL
jgi:hypothetical protein